MTSRTDDQADNDRISVRHLHHRRRPAGRPARLRHHAADRPGRLGTRRRTTTRRSGCCAAPSSSAITFIDTADSYGPNVAEELIARGAAPVRRRPRDRHQGRADPAGPGQLDRSSASRRTCASSASSSLRRLGVERIDLFQLHRIDPDFPLEDQVGELKALQDEGKIRHIGLSEVTVDELEAAQQVAEIVSVQNLYNLGDRALRGRCSTTARPRASASSRGSRSPTSVDDAALAARSPRAHDATPSQLALAWLLRLSPVMLPIPGTSSGRAPRGEHRGRRASS